MSSYWALVEKRVDASAFFRELPRQFPEATTLFIEGSVIADEVKAVLQTHAQAGPYLPNPGTMGQEGGYFRCAFSPRLLSELERLSENHAEPELCDHLLVYRGNDPLLEFYDFPENEVWLPLSLSEDRVRALASALDMEYRKR